MELGGLNSNEKGFIGELRISNVVYGFNTWFKGGKVLRNLYIPKENGETTEIDLVYITKKGIFVFESKNYSGIIKGDKDDLKWTVEYQSGSSYSFYSPIKQNETHIRCLKNIVGDDVPIFSIIVFSNNAVLYLPEKFNFNLYVVSLENLKGLLKSVWSKSRTVLKRKQVKMLYYKLRPMTVVSNKVKQEHIENIRKNYSGINTDFSDLNPKYNTLNNVDMNKSGKIAEKSRKICPCCGKALVLKTATKGDNIGSQFYGCIGWPDCNYTEDLKGHRNKRYRKYYGYNRKKR